ncbi:MAG: hypothetical protein CfP315_0689 [Candidatus Improbicoccus pseudotrichonymphae]|uniref:Uncharacterized protein n=1 Tax=Candidatus Improbicoccus pseudotrichonymphae TaxID=3033792 RepID=A0AA48HYK4_9FIRM|nr:MAG: hypothetical protein CfP315_0689 [Candidatus Improbicoccus pseudotrichonymphae]
MVSKKCFFLVNIFLFLSSVCIIYFSASISGVVILNDKTALISYGKKESEFRIPKNTNFKFTEESNKKSNFLFFNSCAAGVAAFVTSGMLILAKDPDFLIRFAANPGLWKMTATQMAQEYDDLCKWMSRGKTWAYL